MAKNFPNLGRERDIQIQEAQKFPNRLNLNRARMRYMTIKLSEVKDKEFLKQHKKREKLYTRDPP